MLKDGFAAEKVRRRRRRRNKEKEEIESSPERDGGIGKGLEGVGRDWKS